MKKELVVSQESVQDAWRNGNPSQREMLEHLFGNDCKVKITDVVKSYEDACKVLGIKPVNFDYLPEREKRHVSAMLKLETITKALNEGWEHPQKRGECYVYWPCFIMLKENELDEYRRNGYTVVRVQGIKNTAGLAGSYSHRTPSYTAASLGSRLCFKSSDLALYAATTFTQLYADYLLLEEK